MKKIELHVCDGCTKPILPTETGILMLGGAIPINGTPESRDFRRFVQASQLGLAAFSLPGDEWVKDALSPDPSGGVPVDGPIPLSALHTKCFGMLVGILTPTTTR